MVHLLSVLLVAFTVANLAWPVFELHATNFIIFGLSFFLLLVVVLGGGRRVPLLVLVRIVTDIIAGLLVLVLLFILLDALRRRQELLISILSVILILIASSPAFCRPLRSLLLVSLVRAPSRAELGASVQTAHD